MTNSNRSLPTYASRHIRLSRLLLIPGIVGLLDATYLTSAHYSGRPVACSVLGGCEQVTTSAYATIGGIPLALFGAFYYLAVILLIIVSIELWNKRILGMIALLTGIGFIVSLVLLYLQAYVINAFCLYCLVSAASTTIIFFVTLYLFRFNRSTASVPLDT